MPEFAEDGGLLQALREDEIPPSTLDINDLVAVGRRRVRQRNWIGAAVATAVVVAAIPLLLTKARSPSQPPVLESAHVAPAGCVAEMLPIPKGHKNSRVHGGDTSGRYITGEAYTGTTSVPVVWDGGKVMPLDLPVTSSALLINAHGVITSHGAEKAWVYRDGKYADLAQPPGGAFHVPVAINNAGQILGVAPRLSKGETGSPPLIWGSDGTIQAVADKVFWARALDDDGTVVGQESFRKFAGDIHGLLWRPGHPVIDLPSPSGPGRVGPLSIRNGWVGGVAATDAPIDPEGMMKPTIFHLGTGESLAVPQEVSYVEDVNPLGWAAVNLTGPAFHVTTPALLADGKLIALPMPAGTTANDAAYVNTISDDGRVLAGGIHSDQAGSVRWLCK